MFYPKEFEDLLYQTCFPVAPIWDWEDLSIETREVLQYSRPSSPTHTRWALQTLDLLAACWILRRLVARIRASLLSAASSPPPKWGNLEFMTLGVGSLECELQVSILKAVLAKAIIF